MNRTKPRYHSYSLCLSVHSCALATRVKGDRIAFDETIGRALQGDLPDHEITSRTAAAHMIALVAEELAGGLQYKLGDGVLVLGGVLPEPEGLIG